MNGSTLRETLANTSVYEKIVGDMGISTTQIDNGWVLQRWDCRFTNPQVRRHVVENVLGSWQTYTRDFLHLDPDLTDSIWFEHEAPEDSTRSLTNSAMRRRVLFIAASNSGRGAVTRKYRDQAYAVNVEGTRNIVAACQSSGVSRLVHTSSVDVCFNSEEDLHMNEHTPYATRFNCLYIETKIAAEQAVLSANGQRSFDTGSHFCLGAQLCRGHFGAH